MSNQIDNSMPETSSFAITEFALPTALPRLGVAAPEFEAVTTHGKIRLEDYRGNWLVLFSHPADFTPVCTTEFLAFAAIAEELRQRNVELLGLSIDSPTSHIAWIRNIKEKLGLIFHFPSLPTPTRRLRLCMGW